MTMEKYVKAIVRKLKCSGSKRKEIKQQLLSDISLAQENGEELTQIIKRMGTIGEIAAEFNENMPPEEIKKYKRTRIFGITGLVLVLIAVIVFGVYWFLPKLEKVGDGSDFEEVLVKAQMKNVIEWVGNDDYDQLIEHSIPLLQSTFEETSFREAKAIISEDWGTLQSYGHFYLTQIEQQGKKYVLGQVTVTYENTGVSYTITLDEDLNLAGIYMK